MIEWKITLEVIGVIGGVATFLAFLLAPMFYLGAKIDAVKSDLEAFRKEMYMEMRDFHGRLCAIEERNKK
jgi:hypothetical protein